MITSFVDPNLDAAIRQASGKPAGFICASDVEWLTSFSASERNIFGLAGLDHCTNLTLLFLYGNQICGISSLVGNDGPPEGNQIYLQRNPLRSDSINIYIPKLQAREVSIWC